MENITVDKEPCVSWRTWRTFRENSVQTGNVCVLRVGVERKSECTFKNSIHINGVVNKLKSTQLYK